MSHRLSLLITHTCSSERKAITNDYLLEKIMGIFIEFILGAQFFPSKKKLK